MARTPKTTTAPTGSIAPLGLRMLPELKQKIEDAAKANGRSMNAEISARLQASFDAIPWLQQNGLLERVEEAAKATGRTAEGEAYARLLSSLNNWDEVKMLRRELDREDKANRALRMEMAELRSEATRPVDTVYLLLDASGYPISWAEIGELWKATTEATGVRVASVDVAVITPDMESNSRRSKEATDLAKRLRAMGKSTVLPRNVPGEDPVLDAITKACAEEDPPKPAKRTRKLKA